MTGKFWLRCFWHLRMIWKRFYFVIFALRVHLSQFFFNLISKFWSILNFENFFDLIDNPFVFLTILNDFRLLKLQNKACPYCRITDKFFDVVANSVNRKLFPAEPLANPDMTKNHQRPQILEFEIPRCGNIWFWTSQKFRDQSFRQTVLNH